MKRYQLTGHALQYFQKSINAPEELSLYNNEITDDFLNGFKGAKNLKVFHLGRNLLPGHGLLNFLSSKKVSTELSIQENQIDDKYLADFEGGTNEYEILVRKTNGTYREMFDLTRDREENFIRWLSFKAKSP